MLGSAILEVAVGVVFVYLLLSLVGSALNEWIAGLFRTRAKTLQDGIRNLLQDPGDTGLAKLIYTHPLVVGLSQRGDKPSYIPSRTFAIALLDAIAPRDGEAGAKSFATVRETLARLPADKISEQVKQALLLLLDEAGGDLKNARQNIERWFDDTMDRVSGWYKRKTQVIIIVLALAVSVGFNADTISIASTLWRDSAMRAAIVAAAEDVAKQPLPSGGTASERIKQLQEETRQLSLPMGWSLAPVGPDDPRQMPSTAMGWLIKIIGLLFTAVAVSLGAPFWFDVLNKLVNLRTAGRQPEKASAEKSDKKTG